MTSSPGDVNTYDLVTSSVAVPSDVILTWRYHLVASSHTASWRHQSPSLVTSSVAVRSDVIFTWRYHLVASSHTASWRHQSPSLVTSSVSWRHQLLRRCRLSPSLVTTSCSDVITAWRRRRVTSPSPTALSCGRCGHGSDLENSTRPDFDWKTNCANKYEQFQTLSNALTFVITSVRVLRKKSDAPCGCRWMWVCKCNIFYRCRLITEIHLISDTYGFVLRYELF